MRNISVDSISTHAVWPAEPSASLQRWLAKVRKIQFRAESSSATVILIPPVLGLYPPLDTSLPFIAERLAARGFDTCVLEFPGQYGNAGEFSVHLSCGACKLLVESLEPPVFVYGICSGALAALATGVCSPVRGIYAWDISGHFDYTAKHLKYFESAYGISFCQATSLVPVQAEELVPAVQSPVTFAYPARSYYTKHRVQQALARLAPASQVDRLQGMGHFPGNPPGSEERVLQILGDWVESLLHINLKS